MKLNKWIDGKVEIMQVFFFLLIRKKNFGCYGNLKFPLAYNGESGSCNIFKTTCSFLMKLTTWIDGKVEIMHILLICLPNINFGCYGNLKLPLVYNGKMRILQLLQKYFSFLMKFATWIYSKVENMHIVLICLPNINFGCYGNLKLPLAYNERM